MYIRQFGQDWKAGGAEQGFPFVAFFYLFGHSDLQRFYAQKQ
jgi:hypothetical protein